MRAKASECMELGMWGQICETSETGGTGETGGTSGTAGRIEKAGRNEKAGSASQSQRMHGAGYVGANM